MKKILFLAAIGLLFAAGNADAKAVKLGKSDDGGSRIAVAKEKRVKSVKCEKGQFKNSDGVCVGCTVANCAECKSAGVCKRCNAGYSLLSGGTCGCASHAVCGDKQICENKICVDLPCPDGYYASEHKCKACSSNCLTCSDQNTCTSCETDKYLSGGSCNTCSGKFAHCLECEPSKCTRCDGVTKKVNGVCVEEEPVCKTSANCGANQVCKNGSCEDCEEGYIKQGDYCVPDGGDEKCSSDEDCDENYRCEKNSCTLKECREIRDGYTSDPCPDDKKTVDAGVTGAGGACHTCEDKDDGNTGSTCAREGEKVGTCAYFYATCPAGWDDNGATAPGCRVCAPRGPYNGECCGDGCNLEKQELTTGNVPNGSTVWWAPDQVAYNAWVSSGHAKTHLAHATVNAKCENGKLSGVPNTTGLTCSGCYTVTCTHAFTSQTFTIGGTSSEKPCKTDSDCSDDQYCSSSKKCEGLSCGTYYCGKANHKCVLCEYCCMSDDDCAKYDISRRKCNNHICDYKCKSNSDCVWGAYCAYGTCQPVSRCEDVGYSSSPNSSGGGTPTNVKAGDSLITCYTR